MTALAQGGAGVALVMCFALLRTGQIGAAAILVAVQSGAVAVTAIVLHQPLMALPPLILAEAFWLLRRETPMFNAHTAAIGGPKLGICAGAVLAALCQSQTGIAIPSSIILLSILLAATRSHPLMQVAALIAAQNGVVLAGCLITLSAWPTFGTLPASLLVPLACLVLPLPLAAGLLVPALAASPTRAPAAEPPSGLAMAWRPSLAGETLGWIDIGLALLIFAATLIVPLDSLASIFAPLLGLDGVIRSVTRRTRHTLSAIRRGASLLQTAFTILAAGAPNPIIAWLAVLAAMAMALLPAMSRRWSPAVLAFLAAGLLLFGVLVVAASPSLLAWFSLFAGLATVAAIVPDLAAVLAILLLRLAIRASWPPSAEALGIVIFTIALLGCAILLINPGRLTNNRAHRIGLLTLSQVSIAALMICTGQAEARFAALILLILLVLSTAAARVRTGPVAPLAVAGLSGVPPFGVFPGLSLAVLTLSGRDPWLLLPLVAALIPIVAAGIPRRFASGALPLEPLLLGHLTSVLSARQIASIAWLPLLLAVAAGSLAPAGLVHWWHILIAGRT